MGSENRVNHRHTAWGQWLGTSYKALLQYLGEVGTRLELLLCTLCIGSGQGKLCNAPPHSPGAICSRIAAMHCHINLEQGALELLQFTATLLGRTGQLN